MFLFGIYIAFGIIVGLIFLFLTLLGGKSASLLEIIVKCLLAAIFWPISICLIKKYRIYGNS